MQIFDLCLAWEWQYDEDFVRNLEKACEYMGVSLLQVTPHNLDSILRSLELNEITFRALLDRASDTNQQFLSLVEWARSHPVYRINPYGYARQSWNKASIHRLFTMAGLHTPFTIVIPPYCEQPELSLLNVNIVGPTFTIKPAHGGGGKGVKNAAKCWDEVLAARIEFPSDQYLLQMHVEPAVLGIRRAWYRVLFCGGESFLCWWDTCTHGYTPVTHEEEEYYGLHRLREIASQISEITKLDLFSSEIALTADNDFIVVDYVNDPVDLRLQSKAQGGVPDEIITAISHRITRLVLERALVETVRV